MGAVHDGQDAGLAGAADQLCHRQDEGRGRGDVADEQHPRAGRHAGPDRFDDLLRGLDRQRERMIDISCASFRAHKAPGAIQGAVLVIGGQHFVTGLQRQRAGHDIEACGGIGHIDKIIWRQHERRPRAPRVLSASGSANRRPRNSTGWRSSSRCHCW